MKTAVLIVAAGRGARLGSATPKQYIAIGGRPILTRTIDLFLSVPDIDLVQVVIGADDAALYDTAVSDLSDPRLSNAVTGGATRSASVRAGLMALAPEAPDRVLIHDAARPFCPSSIVSSVCAELDRSDGAFAALPVVDALWRAEDGQATSPLPRDGLWRAQTPQGFHFSKILKAYERADTEAADDVAIARTAGLSVAIVNGDEANFKITTQDDLARAKRYLMDLRS